MFSIAPPAVKRGTLFDLGANFYEIGRETGQLAARILQGANPAEIPVVNFVTQKLAVNRLALAGLKDRWQLPGDLVARASLVIDDQGVHEKAAGVTRPPQPGRVYKVGLVYIGPDPAIDLTVGGLFDGFRELAVAIRQLIRAPHSSPLYIASDVPATRRLLLPRTRHHVYFVIDEAARVVRIHAVWHASRGSGPG